MYTYLISDIHGCYQEFVQLLKKINFSQDDRLYILGDVVDRGPQPISLLKNIMGRNNVYLLKGNHEAMALQVLKSIADVNNPEDVYDILLDDTMFLTYYIWIRNGGQTTLDQFCDLPESERQDIICYLEKLPNYKLLETNGNSYFLVHAGLDNFSPDKEPDTYLEDDFLWARTDYTKKYFCNGMILVTGHTPTPKIRDHNKPLVYKGNGHIAIDCGCYFGGRLAAYCLETEKTTYVNSQNFSSKKWENYKKSKGGN